MVLLWLLETVIFIVILLYVCGNAKLEVVAIISDIICHNTRLFMLDVFLSVYKYKKTIDYTLITNLMH